MQGHGCCAVGAESFLCRRRVRGKRGGKECGEPKEKKKGKRWKKEKRKRDGEEKEEEEEEEHEITAVAGPFVTPRTSPSRRVARDQNVFQGDHEQPASNLVRDEHR
ncbi:hypothetical protein HZU73_01822 [Apis mellifera caucasica]|nr:hypothetical protein HZU73_01822 [Apis mellifera caucasica]KAG9431856.1 hypothetical protein HZU67_06501 [Apis mellifera carnica]